MKGVLVIVLLLIGSQCVVAQGQGIIDFSLRRRLAQGYEQNEGGQYLEAYRTFSVANDSLEASMRRFGRSVADLDETEFGVFYWPIKKSVAEVAYMLGMHREMGARAREMGEALEKRGVDARTPEDEHRLADWYKIKAGRSFLVGNYAEAEEELYRALAYASPFDKEFISILHEELAQLYYRQGRYREASDELDTILEFSTSQTRLKTLSQRALCRARLGDWTEALRDIDIVVKQLKKTTDKRAYAEVLRKKGKILVLQGESTGGDLREAKRCYEDYLRLSREYLNTYFLDLSESEREQYWMAEQPFVTDCFRLEGEAPELLYDVVLFGKALLLQMGRHLDAAMSRDQRRQVLASIQVDWRDVQAVLPDSAAAVEFIVYEKKDIDHLAALILTKRGVPKFVYIATMADIAKRIEGRGVDEIYSDSSLYTLIWNEALLQAIGECREVYFAPDGVLHQLAIEYMLPERLRGVRFYRLTSTRLLTEERHKLRTDRMLLLGGVDYRRENGEKCSVGNDWVAYSLLRNALLRLSSLPGSQAEVEEVKMLRNNAADCLLRADSATENALRGLMNKYHMVLISTHGYFDQAATLGTEIRPAFSDAQLSHSCLFLAGAEKNLRDSMFNPTTADGILSARELAGMNLEDVDLAVLSACVSGLGFVTPDGVYGLQRGLKSGGVRAIIVSLWDVDDQATALLMKYLFTNLENGFSLHDAFERARLRLMGEEGWMRRRGGRMRLAPFDRPEFYNAFILIDGME